MIQIIHRSNVTEALDGAFVDRADYKVFLGEPSDCAVYSTHHIKLNILVFRSIFTSKRVEKCFALRFRFEYFVQ